MKKLSTTVIILMLLCLNSFVYAGQAQPDTLNGVIEEYKQDNEGQVISIVLHVLDEDFNTVSYIIEDNTVGRELFDLLGENIDVIGIVKNNKDGSKSITVKEYIVTEEEDDYSPPDDLDDNE